MQAEQEKSKRCYKCEKTKALREFYKCRRNKDGLQDKCIECQRAYDAANKERIAAYQAEYRSENKEKLAAYQAEYRLANKEKLAAQKAEYNRSNPDRKKAADQRRRALKANADGSFTADEWKFTLEVLDYRCVYCGIHKDDTPEKWLEADHLTPLSRGGTNYIDNIVPACKSCNCSKGTKTFDEFIDHLIETGKL